MAFRCPSSRIEHLAAVINEEMLLWGGIAARESTGELYVCSHDLIHCFNLLTSQWNERRTTSNSPSDLPHPCSGARIGVVQNRDIYQFGGGGTYKSSDGRNILLNDLHKLDGLTLEWQRIHPNGESTPNGRSQHGLCVLGKKGDEHLVMMGGLGTKIVSPVPDGSQFIPHPENPEVGLSNEVWLFSIQKRNWIPAQCTGKKPHPRCAHSFTAIDNNRAILIGGNSLHKVLNDAFLFVFSSLEWIEMKLDDHLIPRFFHSAVVVDIPALGGPVAFVLWGYGKDEFPLSVVQMILIDFQKCKMVSISDEPVPTGRQSVCSIIKRGLLFILRYGGSPSEMGESRPVALLDVLKYDLSNVSEKLLRHDFCEPVTQAAISVVTAQSALLFTRWKKFSTPVSVDKGAEISIPNTGSTLRIHPRDGGAAVSTASTTSMSLTVFTFDAKQSQGVHDDEFVSDLIQLSLPSGLTDDDVHIEMCHEHGLNLDPTAPATNASKVIFFHQPHDSLAKTEHPLVFDEKIVIDKAGERKIAALLQSSVVKVVVFPSTAAAAVSSSNSDLTVSFFTHFYGVGRQAFLFRALSFEIIKLPDAWKIDLCIVSTRPEHRDRLIANRSDGLRQPLPLLDQCIHLLLWPTETNVVEVDDIEGWINESRKKVFINMQQLLAARDSPKDAWVETFSFVCNYRDLLQQVPTVTAYVTIESGDRRHFLRIQDSSGNFQEIYDRALQRGSVSINRSRVIVVGQDGAGKSCLVDSLLNRPFESEKASTEGAAVTMSHTAASGWKATDNKEYLDPLIAEGCYRSNLQQTALTESASKRNSSAKVKKSLSQTKEAPKAHHHASQVKTKSVRRAEVVCIEAKTLTHNQQILVTDFLADKPSESDLRERTISVRDIWDLGGQEVYLATHSALMPNSSTFDLTIYMVVLDISKSLSDEAESFYRSTDGQVVNLSSDLGWIRRNEDFPLYWFGSIAACHEETVRGDYWLGEDEEVKPPPVFAIGSHNDVVENDTQRFPDSAAVGKWLNQQGKRFEELLSNSDFVRHIVRPKRSEDRKVDEDFHEISHFVERIFLIDNSVSGSRSPCRGVEEVRRRVDRMASTYCRRMQKQPLFWVYLERLLFHWHKSMKTVVAGVDEIAEIAQKPNICSISSRDEILAALKFLANVGAILFYPEVDGLKDIVFTSPTWVIKALSAFVTSAQPGPFLEPAWIRLKEKGIMSNELLTYRLKQMRQGANTVSDAPGFSENSNPDRNENEDRLIVRLLELLDVIAPLAESPTKEYYVPSMLKKSFSYSPTRWEQHTYSSLFPAPLIVIPTKLKFVPECLYFRLVTRFLKLYSKKPRLSRHQCIFLVNDKESPVRAVEVELLYNSRGKWIALTIRFINEEDPKNISCKFLASIKNEFRRQMKFICQQGMKGFKYSICCQIRKAVHIDKEFVIDLTSLPVIYSDEDEYSPNVAYLCNPFDEPLAAGREDFRQINFWFEQLPASDRDALPKEINPALIRAVATLAEKAGWELLVPLLRDDFGASGVVQYRENYHSHFLRAMAVIEDWMRAKGREATVHVLIKVCEQCSIHRDNVEAAYRQQVALQ
ncbi:uncharacterized protein [Oscarella lobularis]|uniref:uncharacterized protein n=1 Tax=Oscarella lobularis TaxID=121494 RepID=UPI003313751B